MSGVHYQSWVYHWPLEIFVYRNCQIDVHTQAPGGGGTCPSVPQLVTSMNGTTGSITGVHFGLRLIFSTIFNQFSPYLIFATGSSALPAVDHVKDLGVIIDKQLKFHMHINHVVASAFTRANLILKCFTSRHVQTLLRAFKTYVLPGSYWIRF